MVIVSGTLEIRPNARNETIDAIRKVTAATKQEAGCKAYDFYADVLNPDRFLVYEEWTSAEALQSHLSEPHTQAFLAAIGPLAATPATVFLHEISASKRLL